MIASLLRRYYFARVKLVKFRRMLSIPRGHRVLDIGGGDGPFPRADVICEKFLADDSERTNPLGNAGTRALVVGDIERLPFKDGAFDFVFCAHILEHTSDPSRAIAEIQRVGKRGYVEVPSEYMEHAGTSTPTHFWTVERQADGALLFKEKAEGVVSETVNRVFRDQLFGHDPLYDAFYWKNYYPLLNIGVVWDKTIPHRVDWRTRTPNAFVKGVVDDVASIRKALERAAGQKKRGLRGAMKAWITRRFTDGKIRERLLSFVACPGCKGELSVEAPDRLVCRGCKVAYPYVHGVPVLLSEHAHPL